MYAITYEEGNWEVSKDGVEVWVASSKEEALNWVAHQQ